MTQPGEDEDRAREIVVSRETMAIFQKLYDANLELGIEERVSLILKVKEESVFVTRNDMEEEDDLESLESLLELQQYTLEELAPLLRKHKHDILTLLTL